MHRYAERVDSLRERPALDRTGQCPKYRLTQAARATTHEKESFLKAVVSEKGAFAQALNRRGARAFGLQPEESWDIETEDGLRVGLVQQDHFFDAKAVAAVMSVAQNYSPVSRCNITVAAYVLSIIMQHALILHSDKVPGYDGSSMSDLLACIAYPLI